MKLIPRIAAAAIIGLGIGAVDAAAQNAPVPPAPQGKMQPPAPLTAEQVKTVLAGRLVQMRSDLHVGKVTEKDADTYEVELLKSDNSVAERTLVDKTFARPAGALVGHGRHGQGHGYGHGPGGFGPGGFGPGGSGPGGCMNGPGPMGAGPMNPNLGGTPR